MWVLNKGIYSSGFLNLLYCLRTIYSQLNGFCPSSSYIGSFAGVASSVFVTNRWDHKKRS